MADASRKVLYVTATLPALTVTFIYREIFRLRSIGTGVDCVSMNTPAESEISDDARSLKRDTVYLDAVNFVAKFIAFIIETVVHPVRMFRCIGIVFTTRPMQGARDYARLIYHLIEAAYLNRNLDMRQYTQIHAHLINGPTSIAMFLSELSEVPFSFTMHASMIWLDPIAFRNKLERCAFCASISQYNADYVAGEYGAEFAEKIHIVHCGIDPEPEPLEISTLDEGAPIRLLGVGQLNARKGFHVLIEACGKLRERGVDFQCTIVGGGDQREELERMIDQRSLGDWVTLTGPVKHEVVEQHIADCDIFVLPCVISEDGWRDGIPVALMEAMFHRRTVVSSRILGIPELIEDGVSGRLAEAGDAGSVADVIAELAGAPEERARLAASGREKVLAEFNNARSAETLAGMFGAS
jgi:glycosyltransferase involved in cell wall biosynthesis